MTAAGEPGDVDVGFDLLERGDLSGARAALERARRGAPGSPPVLCLEGAIRGLLGETDRAMELFERSAELDPTCPLPWLEAAELELYSRADPEAALEHSERALSLAGLEDDLAGALLLCAEARVALREDGAAREDLAELGRLGLERYPGILARVGQLYLALGDLRPAEAALTSALRLDPDSADAHHALGRIYEQRGDRPRMIRHWLETLRLDRAAPRIPWHLSPEEFEEIAEEALGRLPPELIDRLENVPILVDDAPSADLVREGNDPRLLGLFSGVPLPHKSHVTEQRPSLDSVYLFQRNLERASYGPEDLAEQIAITVAHETAHFFGLEEEDLHALGLG